MHADGDHMRQRLEALFQGIQASRMEGIPVLNPVLTVAAFGFDPHGEHLLGVLLTPWFMNLMLVPQDADAFAAGAPVVGEKRQVALPAGRVEFIVGHEAEFGYFLSCSLFSPVFEFADQEAAEETARAALQEVLGAADAEDDDGDMRAIWEGRLPEPDPRDTPAAPEVSRRQLFRGELTTEERG